MTFAPGIFVNPAALPVNIPVFAETFLPVILPFTLNPVNVPTDVIFG